METVTVKLGTSGRLVLPVKFRKALGVEPGDELIQERRAESARE